MKPRAQQYAVLTSRLQVSGEEPATAVRGSEGIRGPVAWADRRAESEGTTQPGGWHFSKRGFAVSEATTGKVVVV